MYVTLEVVLPSASSDFHDFQSAHSEVTCTVFVARAIYLKNNKGRLAALFPEVTREDFSRSELEYTVRFD